VVWLCQGCREALPGSGVAPEASHSSPSVYSCHVDAEEMLAALRRRGHRVTGPRRLVIQEVAGLTGHISADAIHRAIAAKDPSVNRSTVYRTPDVLERLGYLAHHHEAPGIAYHHVAEHGHLHLACLACGYVAAVDDLPAAEEFVRRLADDAAFHADLG